MTLGWGPCTGQETDCAGVIDAGPEPACTSAVNNEPEILAGYEPSNGGSVSANGQIKVWVQDEAAPFIALGETIDPTTGAITVPGDVTALAPDGYPWEPVLYIGGAAHIPSVIKGTVNPNPPRPAYGSTGNTMSGPAIDPLPSDGGLGVILGFETAEYVWDVATLGLASGTYQAEFVIHDGDRERAIGCVIVTVASQ
jgi:hypothetical protein